MSEEIGYAEMLEIPVSTVNVVKRKGKRRYASVKKEVIDQVNGGAAEAVAEERKNYAESVPISDTPHKKERGGVFLMAEFVAACLLCATIFLTNVFMQDSAINTFLNGLFSGEEKAVAKTYSDFTLSPIVNDFSTVTVSVSPTGVMSFEGEAAVYPVADGVVESVSERGGVYTMSISHSDSFESVITGLSVAYVKAGDVVKGNIPVGYSNKDGKVDVMMYDGETLLNSYAVDSANGIRWNEKQS